MIPLNDRWALAFHELSVDIYERRINQKTGKEYATPRFYYGNLEQALEGIIDRSLVGDIAELKAVVEMIKELKSEIRDFLQNKGSVTGESQVDL